MEIDCSGKIAENEKNVIKASNAADGNVKECEIVDKDQKDMVANTQDSAEAKTADLTDEAAGVDAEAATVAGASPKDEGSIALEIVTKVSDSDDCDNNREDDKSDQEKCSDVLNSSTEDVEKEPSELLVPLDDEYVEQEMEEVEEEEKSSPVKGSEAELLSDTDEFNEEEDEDDYDESSSDVANERRAADDRNRSVSIESEEDEISDADDDVELVPDSSDEDDSQRSQDVPVQNQDIPLSDDEDDDDDEEDYDDDDLMNDVVMSSSKKLEEKRLEKQKKEKKSEAPRKKHCINYKKKLQWNHRVQLKQRSLKWLIKKIQKEPMTGVQYVCQPGPKQLARASSSTPIKSIKSSGVEVISIDLDDSPEKCESSARPTTSQHKESPKSVKQPIFDMQQVDKIRDSIQNAEDLKQQQQQQVKAVKDDQNKENVENNDKLLRKSLKLNGSSVSSSKSEEKTKENDEKSVKIEVMDISTEDDDKTLEVTIMKGSLEEKSEEGFEEKDASEESVKNIMQIEVKHTKQEDVVVEEEDDVNEAVQSEEVRLCKDSENTRSNKSNCKDTQATDLKKPHSSKRPRSASLDNSTKQEGVHPTKKLRAELESNFPTHDRILSEYIEKTSNNSVDEIQKHINQLIIEIQTLNDMIKAKEIEWNNMLHLKKVKEEICFRLSRKKQMMDIMSTKVGEANLGAGDDPINDSVLQNHPSAKHTKLIASTPNVSAVTANFNLSILNNLSNASATLGGGGGGGIGTSSGPISTASSTAQSILQNRANMKSSDLAKEKANTQRLHRNILPKPSSSSSAAVAGFGASPQVSIPTISSTTTPGTTATSTSITGGMGHIPLSLTSAGALGLTANGTSLSSSQPILNSYLTAAATVQQQLGEMLNGHHNPSLGQQGNTNGGQTLMVGRQGVFKDVKSIIADYRQRHPETVPRRGRRVKSNPSATDSSSILSNVLKNDGKLSNSELGVLLNKFDGNSRPSSNDSSHSMTNLIGASTNNTNLGSVSFKDVLVQFAKMSGQTDRLGATVGGKLLGSTAPTAGGGSQSAPPPYPEVTLHPVSTSQSNVDQTGSLLHGILTKYTRPNVSSTPSVAPTSTSQSTTSQSFSSTFSPTLARLLTAPERISTAHNTQTTSNSYQANLQAVQSAVAGSGLNLSKVVGHNSEITITPVISSQPLQQTLLQQQLQQQQQHLKDAIRDRVRSENLLNLDDEADDSVDRLVIDEGGDSAGIDEQHRIAPHAIGQEFHENEVPACQGCKKQEAQFVCAGCGNQWYCSRECQVAAWDEHSEVCTG